MLHYNFTRNVGIFLYFFKLYLISWNYLGIKEGLEFYQIWDSFGFPKDSEGLYGLLDFWRFSDIISKNYKAL